jgi:hypothetical protein
VQGKWTPFLIGVLIGWLVLPTLVSMIYGRKAKGA